MYNLHKLCLTKDKIKINTFIYGTSCFHKYIEELNYENKLKIYEYYHRAIFINSSKQSHDTYVTYIIR
jgi:hypothetical protein